MLSDVNRGVPLNILRMDMRGICPEIFVKGVEEAADPVNSFVRPRNELRVVGLSNT